jgi:hypothetical protein
MLVAVCLFALAIRLLALGIMLPKMKPDVDLDSYRSLAQNLAAGNGFVAESIEGRTLPNVSRTPVYPLFLAALMRIGGDRLGLFLTVQCVLGAVVCMLTILLASRWLSGRWAIAAGLLVALDPNSVVRCVDLRTETLFTLLLVAGACLMVWRSDQPWAWLGGGVCWSMAALCRPIAVCLPVVVLGVLAVARVTWRARFTYLAVFLVGFLPLLGLWMARNAALTGRWFVSTIAISTLHIAEVAGIRAEQTGQNLEAVQQEFVKQYGDVQFVADRAQFATQLDRIRRHCAETLASAPLVVAKHAVTGWAGALFGPGTRGLANSLRESGPTRKWWAPIYVVCLVAWFLASLVGAILLRREMILPTLLTIYFIGLVACTGVNSRYRAPVTPMLSVLAVAGVHKLRRQK